MVALNRISSEARRQHLANVLKEQEKLIIAAALQAGVNPDDVNPASHPAAEDCEGVLEIRLAERVAAYKRLKSALEGA
jgi:hypothetical protein